MEDKKMKNKLMALLVMAIFVVSLVPMAFAEEGSDSETNVETGSDTEAEKEDDGTRLGLRKRLGLRAEVLDARSDVLKGKADVLERRADVVEAKVELLARHKAQIENLIKACEEKGKSAEECRKVYEQRLRNLENLPENFKLRLAAFQARKESHEREFEELDEDKDFGKHKKRLKFKARLVAKTRLEEARKEFIHAKLEFKEAKEKLENARERLHDAQEEHKKACDEPESEECKAVKAEVLASAKEHFSAQADLIVETLEKVKSKVQANEDLSEEEEARLVAELDAAIQRVKAIKDKINAAENKEQLLHAARELRDEWKKIKHAAKKISARVVSSRMAGIIVKSKHLEAKLDRVLARMTENGEDTTEVQSLVDEFRKEVELTRVSFKESQELWLQVKAEARGEAETNATVQQAQAKLKEARDHLNKARELLRQIILKVNKKALAEVESEVETSTTSNASSETSSEASTENTSGGETSSASADAVATA